MTLSPIISAYFTPSPAPHIKRITHPSSQGQIIVSCNFHLHRHLLSGSLYHYMGCTTMPTMYHWHLTCLSCDGFLLWLMDNHVGLMSGLSLTLSSCSLLFISCSIKSVFAKSRLRDRFDLCMYIISGSMTHHSNLLYDFLKGIKCLCFPYCVF